MVVACIVVWMRPLRHTALERGAVVDRALQASASKYESHLEAQYLANRRTP